MENENKELAKAGRAELIAPSNSEMNFGDIQRIASCMIASGFFTNIKEVAQATVKIMAGQDLRRSPVQSLMTIHFINGKLCYESVAMAAALKDAGYRYKAHQNDNEVARIEFFERVDGKWESIGVSEFTAKDAADAGLLSKPGDTWKKYRADMLWARAMSRGCRRYCPDAFGGSVYTKEELEDTNDSAPIAIERTAPAEDLTAILKGKKAKDTINRSNPLENGGTFPAVSEASELTLEQSELPNV